ncbi:MAG TPA: penicillin-binding transpeptidase domain-containing protein [Rhabdochlamydiaceae bacterium]|nr:penicillin-binding transpeptidase domain-containing protein [Rhabdochlamydiaceae bacterium]
MVDHNIPLKANRVLNLILIGLLLILIRVWYLSVIQREEHLQQSRKPQRRIVIEHVERATIRDRFNIPLALNKMQYNAAVCYAQIRQIPSISWKKDVHGKLVRVQERMEYIKNLSTILAKELDMDPTYIEDTIHGKASLFPHTPFAIKEDISEQQYFRLRMLEKDWLGIQMQRAYKRFYPKGKIGADIIGYMGAINQKEYFEIAEEMRELEAYIAQREAGELPVLPKGFNTPMEARERLKQLQEKAYTINDLVGKAGIESVFDQYLRGFYGKKTYEVDVKGNFLRELPGSRKAIGGRRVMLSISSELQEYAETLLTQHETFRDLKDEEGNVRLNQPWIRGGAIVAMIPQTGEIVALASYPRFDPNDFIPARESQIKKRKQASIARWLENETYISDIWDGKRPLERERFSFDDKVFYEDALELTWDRFLDLILPMGSPLRSALDKIRDLKTAAHLQQTMQRLLNMSGQPSMKSLIQALYHEDGDKKMMRAALNQYEPEISKLKQEADFYLGSIDHPNDKLLVIDLCRLVVDTDTFSDRLLSLIGNQSLSSFRAYCQAATSFQSLIRTEIQELYHDIDFTNWRQTHFKTFLKDKRKEEREKKLYTRPYTEYLDALEKDRFQEFWNNHRVEFLRTFILGTFPENISECGELHPYFAYLIDLHKQAAPHDPNLHLLKTTISHLPREAQLDYLKTMRPFSELDRPLLGRYRLLRNEEGQQLEKHLAAAFYPSSGFGYGRSQAYRQSSPLGSVFKLVTAYTGLMERYQSLSGKIRDNDQLNPFTLIDDLKSDGRKNSNAQILGYTLDGQAITRLYKGGRLPRSSHSGIGKVDIFGALEQSSNIYFAILAGEHLQDPTSLSSAARLFGCGELTGIELPGEIPGNVPEDISHNRTGLYSFAIGQHSLIVTPLQTALILSAIANNGSLLKPKIIQIVAGKEPSREEEDVLLAGEYPFKDDLVRIGITFPLFTETLSDQQKPYVFYNPTEIRRNVPLPKEINEILIEGMHRVISGPRGSARPGIIRTLQENPEGIKDFIDLHNQIIGKTGTAQILYKGTIDSESAAEMKNHVWFAGISYSSPKEKQFQSNTWSDPELVVIVYLRYGFKGGKEPAPSVAQMVKKWREICSKHGSSSYVAPASGY